MYESEGYQNSANREYINGLHVIVKDYGGGKEIRIMSRNKEVLERFL